MKSCLMHSLSGLALMVGTAWVLGAAGTAAGQASTPVGVAKPAEYDCAGLEGPALTSCRDLNAAAIKGAMVRPGTAPHSTHDCFGMSGAALATCLDLNGQLPAGTAATVGGGSMGGTTTGTALSNGLGVAQPPSGNALVPGAATPIPQQTTGGTNPVTPRGTDTTATTGGNNGVVPSGAGPPADGSGMTNANGSRTQPVPAETPASSTSTSGVAPGAPQVSPPTDRVVPLAPAAPNSAPARGAVRGTGGGSVSK